MSGELRRDSGLGAGDSVGLGTGDLVGLGTGDLVGLGTGESVRLGSSGSEAQSQAPTQSPDPSPQPHTHQHANESHSHQHSGHKNAPSEPFHTHSGGHGRALKEIRHIIGHSKTSESAKRLAISIFEKLGTAEAKIHNLPIDKIHFHEVGAVDAIIALHARSGSPVREAVPR